MKKKVYLIILEEKVNSENDSWHYADTIFAVTTFKQALIDIKKMNKRLEEQKINYLLFRYRIKIVNLFE